MGKIKIHEIAKEVGLTSKEILNIANSLGIGVTSHLSAIDDEQANKIRENVGTNKKPKKEEKPAAKLSSKEATSNSKKAETPVIIRREVIISEDETKKEEKKQENKEAREKVGFVERNNNKNYNIVYRNKQTKPLTVSELFGLKPKEEEKKEETNPKEEVKNKENKEIKQEPVKEEVEVNQEEKNIREDLQNKNVDNRNNNFPSDDNRCCLF